MDFHCYVASIKVMQNVKKLLGFRYDNDISNMKFTSDLRSFMWI